MLYYYFTAKHSAFYFHCTYIHLYYANMEKELGNTYFNFRFCFLINDVSNSTYSYLKQATGLNRLLIYLANIIKNQHKYSLIGSYHGDGLHHSLCTHPFFEHKCHIVNSPELQIVYLLLLDDLNL